MYVYIYIYIYIYNFLSFFCLASSYFVGSWVFPPSSFSFSSLSLLSLATSHSSSTSLCDFHAHGPPPPSHPVGSIYWPKRWATFLTFFQEGQCLSGPGTWAQDQPLLSLCLPLSLRGRWAQAWARNLGPGPRPGAFFALRRDMKRRPAANGPRAPGRAQNLGRTSSSPW